MFSTNRKEAKNAAEATTLIATGTEIKGDISFSGRLHIDGKIDGAIRGNGPQAMLTSIASSRQNWSHLRQTSS